MRDTGREVAIHRGRILVASVAVLAAVLGILFMAMSYVSMLQGVMNDMG